MTRDVIQVVGVGAGGHAKVVADILRLSGGFRIIGLLDRRPELVGAFVGGVEVLGDDGLLAELRSKGVRHAFVGVGGVGDMRPRERLYSMLKDAGYDIVKAIHPTSVIAASAVVGAACTVMAGAVINSDAKLGVNVIINTCAVVEHDCEIGDHAHIATGAKLASTVRVGRLAHVGIGATVRQNVSIGERAVIGAGAVVVGDVPPRVVAVGVPARIVKQVGG